MAIMISIGKWGGVYGYFRWSWRVCLGWIAITIFPTDGDNLLALIAEAAEKTEE